MYYGLVYFPRIEHSGFHAFRKEYDPFTAFIPEHITFIYPVPETIDISKLESHINSITEAWRPFSIHFCEIDLTKDHWLFLGAKEGKREAIKLHDELYTGILSEQLRKDLPYDPRLGLGLFSKEKYDITNPTAELTLDYNKYTKARKKFEAFNFKLHCTIDKLTLLKINTDFTKYEEVLTFNL